MKAMWQSSVLRRIAFVLFAMLLLGILVVGQAAQPAQAQTTNLALNKPVTCSSTESGTFPCSAAVDGNTGTRWSSAFSDPQWILVDLGATYNITRVVLNWEAAYGRSYQIQVSANASTWTSIYSTTTGNGATDDLTGLSGSGRYVRMYGTVRATGYGYSLWELQVYGSSGTATTPPPTTPPATTPPPTTPAPTTQPGQSPYGGTPWAVPGTVQAENYDLGGEGVAYHDTTSGNSGGALRTDGVDIQATTDTGGGNNVGWTAAGEWLEYTINVTAGGTYAVNARVAAPSAGGSLHVEIDGANVTGAMVTPATGGWQTWTTVTRTGVALTAGQHVMRIAIDAAGFNLNWVSLTSGTTPPTTPPPTTPPPTTPPATTPPATTPPATTPPATTPPPGSVNLAAWHTAVSSSNENAGLGPHYAVDGNTSTRWASAFSDPQWIYVDLGATATVNRVVLRWEAAYGTAYQMQVSGSSSGPWTTIYSTTTGNGGSDDLTGLSGSGRYVRMYGTARATGYGYSLFELEVYGSGGMPYTPPPPTPTPMPSATPKPLNPSQWDAQINSLMSQLTLQEKVGMMTGDATGFATNPVPRLGIPSLRMSDGPHGIRGGTLWPALVAAAGSFDPALEQQVGTEMAKEFRALGRNVSLGPMLNLIRDGRWGRANETYSEDPFLSGKMAAARIRGIQSVGVIADPKHYAANNIEEGRGRYPVQMSERTLRELYTYNFMIAVKEGDAWSIMAAYNDVNGYACAANNHLLTRILKNDWGFQGWVVSDWGAAYGNTVGDAWGGLDIEMPSPGAYSYANLSAAIANGSVPQSLVDDKVRRILLTMYKAGMMVPGYNPTAYTADLNSAAHKALALQAARESIVLAKNNGNILPLNRATSQRIAIIGPYATNCRNDGGGSGSLNGPYCINITQGITSKIAGSSTTIVSDWATADYVFVVVGINDLGEGFDRTNVDLPVVNGVDQNALVAQVMAAKPNRTVVVYTGGSAAVAGSWSNAPAVIIALYPGQEQGNALADIIFGDYNPGGRLSISFPNSADQLPPWGNAYNVYEPAGEGRGYTYYDKHNLTPLFAFGHGLSYTTFAYSNLRISGMTVQVDVRNSGTRTGDEVVQLYVSDVAASVDRRVKDLRGFKRITLAPGATTTVTFTLTDQDLAFWSDTANGWVVEPGAFNIMVGSSSRDIRLQGTLNR